MKVVFVKLKNKINFRTDSIKTVDGKEYDKILVLENQDSIPENANELIVHIEHGLKPVRGNHNMANRTIDDNELKERVKIKIIKR